MWKPLIFFAGLVFIAVTGFAQGADRILNADEALRIEKYLASDDLKGRKVGSAEIDKAANFIDGEFRVAGLKHFDTLSSFLQTFTNIRSKLISAAGRAGDLILDGAGIIAVSADSVIRVDERSPNYLRTSLQNADSLLSNAQAIIAQQKNIIVFVKNVPASEFSKLKRFARSGKKSAATVIFLLSESAEKFSVEVHQVVTEITYRNVIGVLPGRSKKDELVVFSGHYDHLGVGKPDAAGDSIYNGANDDAAGTTGVIMLAKYFARLKNNERTLVFVAFTAEESGGFGSQYFSSRVDPQKVAAMFNLEMIGTESKWGTNSAYITGFEKSDFGLILQKNLAGSAFRFEPDPYPEQKLFYRSDNATLAALGVPAHTISTSKMDTEPNYHKQSDDVPSLNMANMAEVIKAIALSSRTIISGEDTPTRVSK